MQMNDVSQFVTWVTFVLLLVMFLGPPLLLAVLYRIDRRQTQHAILRNFPILGRLRDLLEHIGPEFRQYLFDGDLEGKPFTREGYRSIVYAGKYMTLGEDLEHPWVLRGLIGMSAMSYGALGQNAIQAFSHGLARATGSWLNTGEGGLSEHHLVGGGDAVCQIGPGLFGFRTPEGEWSWEAFRDKAAISSVCGFELKLHQGGKPVGLKIVIGGPGFLDELAATIRSPRASSKPMTRCAVKGFATASASLPPAS